MASDTTQTEVITMNKMSSASDEGTEPEVTVKLYPTMYENANAVWKQVEVCETVFLLLPMTCI